MAHEKIKEQGLSSDIVEACLAHIETNKIKVAYNRESKMKCYEEKKNYYNGGLIAWINKKQRIKI